MSLHHELRKRLAQPTPELVRATLAGEIEWGVFLADDRPHLEISGLGDVWRGLSLLSSWAPTPFVLDGEAFASVESFYHALKYEAGSQERGEIAAMEGWYARRRARRRRRATLLWRGEEIAVGSPEHCEAVAAAVVEKVRRHRDVADALLATGRGRLILASGNRNALAIATPHALMIERAKLLR